MYTFVWKIIQTALAFILHYTRFQLIDFGFQFDEQKKSTADLYALQSWTHDKNNKTTKPDMIHL